MDKFKSAQGLSLSTMIIGIIVLVVLMVLVALFGGFFGNKFNPGFKEATEQECKGLGYKAMPDECAPNPATGFNYEQVYAKFAEGVLETNEVCCKSSCEVLNGKCEETACPKEKTEIPKGKNGCATNWVCCTK